MPQNPGICAWTRWPQVIVMIGAEGGNRTHTTVASPRILRSCHRLPATHSGSMSCISNILHFNQLHPITSKQDLRFLGPICIGLEKNRQEIGNRLQPGHNRCAADPAPGLCITPVLQGSSPHQTGKDLDLILFLKESGQPIHLVSHSAK